MKTFDVITIGSATRDVFLRCNAIKVIRDDSFVTGEAECFALGSKIDIDEIIFETGGGATNAAVSFARQGLAVAFSGKVGASDARGQEILSALKQEHVDVSLSGKDKKQSTGYSVLLLTPRGERTVLVYRGASADFQKKDFSWPKMKAHWIYVSSLAGKLDILRTIWKHAAAMGAKIAWDPGSGELQHGLEKLRPFLKQAAIVHLNQEEASRLMGYGYTQDAMSFDHIRKIVSGVTIVSAGSEGALGGTQTESWHAGAHPIQITDTTGAGDAFTSGFVAAYIRSKGNIPQALQFATANAESVIQHHGAKTGLLRTTKVTDPVDVVRR